MMPPKIECRYYKNKGSGTVPCEPTDPDLYGVEFAMGLRRLALVRGEFELLSSFIDQCNSFTSFIEEAHNTGYRACGKDIRDSLGLT